MSTVKNYSIVVLDVSLSRLYSCDKYIKSSNLSKCYTILYETTCIYTYIYIYIEWFRVKLANESQRWTDRVIGGWTKKNRWREIEGKKVAPTLRMIGRRSRRSLETASSRTLLDGRSCLVADFNGGFLRLANRTRHETPSTVSRSVIQRFDDFTAKRGEIYIVASYVIWFEESSSKRARVGHALCLVACLATFTLVLNLRLDTPCFD